MTKYMYLKLIFLLIFTNLVACGGNESDDFSRRRPKKGVEVESVLPAKGAKIALVFMPGAGAYEASARVLAKMENDLAKPIKQVVDAMVGASSGALLSGALDANLSAQDIADDTGAMITRIFPDIQPIVTEARAAGLSDAELNKFAGDIVTGKISFSSDLAKTFSSISGPVRAKLSSKAASLTPIITNIISNKAASTNTLKTEINNYLGSAGKTIDNSKLLIIASDKTTPIIFSSEDWGKKSGLAYGAKTTLLVDALLASACIPAVFDSPSNISIDGPGGSRISSDLRDGSFSLKGNFDPSSIAFEIVPKIFDGQDILIILVSNGGPTDKSFRKMHLLDKKDSFQTKTAQGKVITYIAIDLKILKDKDDMFYVAGFDGSSQMSTLMKEAAKESVASEAYKFAVDSIKAAQGL